MISKTSVSALFAFAVLAGGAGYSGTSSALAASLSQSVETVEAKKVCKSGYRYSKKRKKCVRVRRGSH